MTKKEIENYRLKFLDWSSEYLAGCRMREIEDKERDDLTMQSCNDLFEEFFKKNQQFIDELVGGENTEDITKYGLIEISDIVLNEKYIKCKECKSITYNDDDNVCLACGSKKTLRLIK